MFVLLSLMNVCWTGLIALSSGVHWLTNPAKYAYRIKPAMNLIAQVKVPAHGLTPTHPLAPLPAPTLHLKL